MAGISDDDVGRYATDQMPTVILLLRETIGLDEAKVRLALGEAFDAEAAASFHHVGANAAGMSYYEWYAASVLCHLGHCTRRYRDVGGVVAPGARRVTEWHDRELPPPKDPEIRPLWDGHSAWLYVDAIAPAEAFLAPLLRVAVALADENCLLVWRLRGAVPAHGDAVLPNALTKRALAAGIWPT